MAVVASTMAARTRIEIFRPVVVAQVEALNAGRKAFHRKQCRHYVFCSSLSSVSALQVSFEVASI
jgi:hypothetical protein